MYHAPVKDEMYRGRAYRFCMPEQPSDRLRRARIKAGYKTATDVCRAFGWPYETYKKTETGERKLTPDKARRYGPPLRASPAYLLTGEGSEEAPLTAREREHISQIRSLTEPEQHTVFLVCDRLYQGHETVEIEEPAATAKRGRR